MNLVVRMRRSVWGHAALADVAPDIIALLLLLRTGAAPGNLRLKRGPSVASKRYASVWQNRSILPDRKIWPINQGIQFA